MNKGIKEMMEQSFTGNLKREESNETFKIQSFEHMVNIFIEKELKNYLDKNYKEKCSILYLTSTPYRATDIIENCWEYLEENKRPYKLNVPTKTLYISKHPSKGIWKYINEITEFFESTEYPQSNSWKERKPTRHRMG